MGVHGGLVVVVGEVVVGGAARVGREPVGAEPGRGRGAGRRRGVLGIILGLYMKDQNGEREKESITRGERARERNGGHRFEGLTHHCWDRLGFLFLLVLLRLLLLRVLSDHTSREQWPRNEMGSSYWRDGILAGRFRATTGART